MRACRIYTESPLDVGSDIALNGEQRHYLRHVMRARAGGRIILFNGRGGEYEAVITRLDKSEGACHIETYIAAEREMPCRVHIVQAACRTEKIERVLQKATELGAAGFQIARCQRSTLRMTGDRLDSRLQRWRKIILEAVEQSGRTRIPTLAWRESLPDIRLAGRAYALHPDGGQSWAQARGRIAAAGELSMVIGPEGGFSKHDLQILSSLNCTTLAFGPRIMRTETAAPALLAAIQAVQEKQGCLPVRERTQTGDSIYE